MRSHRNSLLSVAILFVLMSCNPNVPYHHFEEISELGWDKEDTLNFGIDTLTETGNYTLTLNLRTTNLFPYRNLSVEVDEMVFPSRAHRVYPVYFETVTEEGEHVGTGLSQHDLSKVLTCQHLYHGDSIHIKVYHKMRRMMLPGITDIGIKLEK